jgi:hypothetical protein
MNLFLIAQKASVIAGHDQSAQPGCHRVRGGILALIVHSFSAPAIAPAVSLRKPSRAVNGSIPGLCGRFDPT